MFIRGGVLIRSAEGRCVLLIDLDNPAGNGRRLGRVGHAAHREVFGQRPD